MNDFISSNLSEELDRIDSKIAEWNEDIARGKDLEALLKDPRFKRIILDGYIEAEAKKLFTILTDPSGVSSYTAEEIQLKLAVISHFKGYVGTEGYPGTIKENAARAPELIANEEAYRKQVTANIASGDDT